MSIPAASPGMDAKVRPSAWWYVVPAVVWLVCLVLFGFAVKAVADFISAGIDPVANHAQILVPDDGLTVYTTTRRSGDSCTLTDAQGRRVALNGVSGEFNLDLEDTPRYYALASTPKGLPAGGYTLDCTGIGIGTQLGTGKRIDAAALALRVVWGVVVPLVLGLGGLIVLIVLLVKRHNSKMRIRSVQDYGAQRGPGPYGRYPPPAGAPGPYPPPSGTPGRYPPPLGPPAQHPLQAPPTGPASPPTQSPPAGPSDPSEGNR